MNIKTVLTLEDKTVTSFNESKEGTGCEHTIKKLFPQDKMQSKCSLIVAADIWKFISKSQKVK